MEKLYECSSLWYSPSWARFSTQFETGLETLKPDCLLIEGPPEANNLLPLLIHEDMEPPVALLLYAQDDRQRQCFIPLRLFLPNGKL